MSLVKLANESLKVSFTTDRQTWNDGLGKLLLATKYLAGVGSSRSVTIHDFFNTTRDKADLKLYIDGDGHCEIRDLKVNGVDLKVLKKDDKNAALVIDKL